MSSVASGSLGHSAAYPRRHARFPPVILEFDELHRRGHFVEYRGVRMLVVDGSELRTAEDIDALAGHVGPLIQGEPKGSVRIVLDVTGLRFDRRSVTSIKKIFVDSQPWIRASSLVGVSGLQRVLLQILNQVAKRERPLFDTVDAAKDWLATQQ
jgi:hypothetical protein